MDRDLLEFFDRFKNDLDCKEYLAIIKNGTSDRSLKCNHNACQVKADFGRQCNICNHKESTSANTLLHKVKFGLRNVFFICFEVFKSTKILLASYIRVRYGVTEKQIGCL
jgi:hypothetical protein